MREVLTFTFEDGYYNAGTNVQIPEGAILPVSSNIVYTLEGTPVSFRGFSTVMANGGTRSFVLDENTVGFLGSINTTPDPDVYVAGVGNIIQGVEKSLWFVGNELTNGVKIIDISDATTTNTFNLDDTPQVAYWQPATSDWGTPMQVGLPEFLDSETPTLEVTSSSTRSTGFDGLVKGSRSVRVARKRHEVVSVATASSPVVTASETGDSLLISIPVLPSDGSAVADNSWIIYCTLKGQGSTSLHFQFPIEIPEASLRSGGSTATVTDGNAKAKVIKQSTADQNNRIVEIEFNDNELLPDNPDDDTFAPGVCKFLAKLGNVMCAIGTGTDLTGFDVSYPNEYQAFPPDWTDWFAEVPVGVAPQEDMGFFWVATTNNTYIARWTGVTEGSAPVIIEKISNTIGSIGDGAMTTVNGVLYMLANGKLPVAISPDGQVNSVFGSRVKNYFTSFNNTTQVTYDGASDTVIFACGTSALGYQVSTDKWTAPITLGADSVLSMFAYEGQAYMCTFASGAYSTKLWGGGTSPTSTWILAGAFQFGQSGRALKDIIQVETILSHTVSDAGNSVINVRAYKNYDTATTYNLASETVASPVAGASLISVRKYAESLDYDAISARISGSLGGVVIHSTMFTVDVHSIERLT